MSRFRKLSQTIWYCQYHVVGVPKYRYRILKGKIADAVENCVRGFFQQLGGEITELNVQFKAITCTCFRWCRLTARG